MFAGGFEQSPPNLLIIADEETRGTVEMPGVGFSTAFTVAARAVTVVRLPVEAVQWSVDAIENRGVHVTAERDITVVSIGSTQRGTATHLALPTDALGTEYIASGQGRVEPDAVTRLAIVATAARTTVAITPSVPTTTRGIGVTYSVTLEQGETYQLQSTGASAPHGFVGTAIVSDKPVAVFDGAETQMIPVTSWGRDFFAAPLTSSATAETFRFVASADNTGIRIDGAQVVTLNRGQFYEQNVRQPSRITSDQPISVARYISGNTNERDAAPQIQTIIPSTEQYLTSYTVSPPTREFTRNYISLVVPNAGIESLTLNGVPVAQNSFTSIGASGFSIARIEASPAQAHYLSGDVPFGLFIHGQGDGDSLYAYPGGLSVTSGGRIGEVGEQDILGQTSSVGSSTPCSLYPIALHERTLAGVSPGTVINDIFNGSQSGNFGWLTWTGDSSVPALTASLTPPGDSNTYTNPDNAADREVSIGDWARGKPGVSNSSSVRGALDALKSVDITVPVWNETRGQGGNAAYRVSAFARVRLIDYRLPGQSRITARFLGYAQCPTPVNQVPTVSAGADQTISLPGVVNLNGAASDDGLPQGSTLSVVWSKASGPGAVTFGNAGQTATTAAFSQPGIYALQLSATDSELTSRDEMTVTVSPANRAPVVNAGQDQTITLPDTARLNGSATDDGLPTSGTLTRAWSKVSGPGDVTFANSNDAVTTATFGAAGTYVLQLNASDGELSAGDDVVVIVNRANEAPVVSAGVDSTITQPSLATLSGAVTDDGLPQGGTLDITWSKQSGPGAVNFANPRQATTTASFGEAGIYVLRLTVSDGQLSASDEVTITVNSPNQPPAVSAGDDLAIEWPDDTLDLNGTVSDDNRPHGETLAVSWAKISGPGEVSFGSAGAAQTTARFGEAGIYTLRLTANDSELSGSDDITITVHPANQPPTVMAGTHQTITLPDAASLTGTATDDRLPVGGTLITTWSKVSGPGGVAFGDPAQLTTTANFSAPGTYILRLTANDSRLTGSSDVIITVVSSSPAANRPPTVSAGNDQSVAGSLVAQLTGAVSDDGLPTGDALISSWTKVSGPGEVVFGDTSAATTSAAFSVAGVYALRLTASDSELTGADDVIVVAGAPDLGCFSDDFNDNTQDAARWTTGAVGGMTIIERNGRLEITPPVNTVGYDGYYSVGSCDFTDSRATVDVVQATTPIYGMETYFELYNAQGDYLLFAAGGGNFVLQQRFSGIVSRRVINFDASLHRIWRFRHDRASDAIFWETSADGVTWAIRHTEQRRLSITALHTLLVAGKYTATTPTSTAIFDNYRVEPNTLTTPLAVSLVSPAGGALYTAPARIRIDAAATNNAVRVEFFQNDILLGADETAPYGFDWANVAAGEYTLTARVVDAAGASAVSLPVNATVEAAPPTAQYVTWASIVNGGDLGEGSVGKNSSPACDFTATSRQQIASGDGYFEATPAADNQIIRIIGADNSTREIHIGHGGWMAINENGITVADTCCHPARIIAHTAGDRYRLEIGGGTLRYVRYSRSAGRSVLYESATPLPAYPVRLQLLSCTPNAEWHNAIFNGMDAGTPAPSPTPTPAPTPTPNTAPVVDAGADQTIVLPDAASLSGAISDDGLPLGGTLTIAWTKASGPGAVAFADANQASATAVFSEAGLYVLRLTASDGQFSASDEISISVGVAPANRPPAVAAGADQAIVIGVNLVRNAGNDEPLIDNEIRGWTAVTGAGWTQPPAGTENFPASVRGGSYFYSGEEATAELRQDVDVRAFAAGVAAGTQSFEFKAYLRSRDEAAPDAARVVIEYRDAANERTLGTLDSGPITSVSGWHLTEDVRPAPAGTGWVRIRLVATRNTGTTNDAFFDALSLRPVSAGAVLSGTVTDDGLPTGNALTVAWSKVSGPGEVAFADTRAATTSATFTGAGIYVLRLSADDSQFAASDEVTVTVSPANTPPSVDAGENQTVTLPGGAQLNGAATDDGLPASGALLATWSKVSGPGTVAFTEANQAATTATFSEAGGYVLRLTADDGEYGAGDEVTITVNPSPVNQAPAVNAGADQTITLPVDTLSLNGAVTDDGLPSEGQMTVAWSVVSGAAAVAFGNANQAATTATFGAAGVYALRLTASDGQLTASDEITVTVSEANRAPSVSAGADQTITLPSAAELSGAATDDGLPTGSTLALTWEKVSGAGAVTFGDASRAATSATFSEAGIYVLRLTANDSELPASDEVTVTVNPASPAPVAQITSPADGAVITERTVFTGTISEGSRWRLEYALAGGDENAPPPSWTTIGAGDGATGGALGLFDPTMLLNGTYSVRLVATNAAGQTSATVMSAVVEGNQKIGNFTLAFDDLSVALGNLPIQVVRGYDSRDRRAGDFGAGWTLGLRSVRLEKSGALGRGWEQTSSGGVIPRYCVGSVRPRFVTVTFPDGQVYRFNATTAPACQTAQPITTATMTFAPAPGTHASLAVVGSSDVFLGSGGQITGATDLLGTDGQIFNPTLFRLTTADGAQYVIDSIGGLQSVTDANGNTLSVTRDRIEHSSGQSVRFVRDAQGRITQAIDPAGNALSYAYDAAGDLVSVTDRENKATTFSYDGAHRLLTITDARGIQPVRNDYDADGRLVSHTDATGKVVAYVHALAARQETVTDRTGNRTVYEYDARGNVVRVEDARGGVTVRSYDADDNLLTETNALNHTTTYTYDAVGNRTSGRDPLGNVTRYTYNARRQVLTMTDARGAVTENSFDERGNLLTTRDALGQTTTHTYNARGLRLSTTDARGGVTRYEYDAQDNLARETDALGHATAYTSDANNNRTSQTVVRTAADGTTEELQTRFEYDRAGRLVKTIQPDGSTSETVYTSTGQPAVSRDALGRETKYEYDQMGRLTKTIYADATQERAEYDAEGRRVASVDRAGRRTIYAFDALGRLTRTTFADNAFVSSVYDASGRVTATTDGRGQTSGYEYDAAGRRVRVTDAAGSAVTFGYDAAGNQVSLTDGRGQTTRYEYDGLSRRTRTVYADGTSDATTYDALGQVTSRSDQAGNVTGSEYDAVGRLVRVIDALAQATSYGYNEVGQQVSQTDALNRTTRYEYDRLGRRVRRVLPMGQAERYEYNASGRLTSRTDFNNRTTTYSYDVMGRLVTRQADATFNQAAVTYTYTAAGQRATMRDRTGVTAYAYDARGRLLSRQTPQGTLTYSYDAAGNLISTRSSNENGASVNYTYDAANRLATAIDNRLPSGSATTRYAYDANGNLATVGLPNTIATAYTYNPLNRLTNLSTSNTSATVASYGYTLGAAGNRLSVTEGSGRTVAYAYDALLRLTRETITNDGQTNGEVGYGYDAVGNRLARTSTVPNVTASTSAYDANDRLASDTYDAAGNTVNANGNAYSYDFENRLVAVNGGAVRYEYDGDGHRVAKSVNGVTTTYLVDTNNPTGYAQVVEEMQGGVVTRAYAYGHDLISQRQLINNEWVTSFYGYDGHGSVRYLTNTEGSITDTYAYDAFGTLISRTGATPNEYLYAGERFDVETGMYHLRARYMNPASGRFWTQDSYEGANDDPLSLHKYVYANGNPANNTDPSGYMTLADTQATMLVLGGLATIAVIGYVATQDRVRYGERTRTYEPSLPTLRPSPSPSASPSPERVPHPDSLEDIRRRRPQSNIYAFGNASGPAVPRAGRDVFPDASGFIGHEAPPLPRGMSAWDERYRSSGLTGVVWFIPQGIQLPHGLAITYDGLDVVPNSPQLPGHHTIYPSRRMRLDEFTQLYLGLPWQRGERIK